MTYQSEMELLIDADGLVGLTKDPADLRKTVWTSGNSLLESYTDLIIRKKLNCLTNEDKKRMEAATWKCWNRYPTRMFNKSPTKWNTGEERLDQITHDDVLGVSCGSKECDLIFAQTINAYGEANRYWGSWLLSNTGKAYWDAWVKPWHLAVYKLNAGKTLSPILKSALIWWIGKPEKNNPESNRLKWIVIQAVRGKNKKIDDQIDSFMRELNLMGGIKEQFKQSKGEWHPFAKYGAFVN